MRQVLFIPTAIFTLFALLLIASDVDAQSQYTYLDIHLLNQDPYPAQPDNYVEVVFKLENEGGKEAMDVMVEILPEYPFSLDPSVSGLKKLGTIGDVQSGEEAVFVKYRLRVDRDAIDGENKLRLRFTYNTAGKWDNYHEREFNITIEDPRTDFDIAIQDYSPATGTLSIAVSNVGDSNAGSVSVMLPEQSSLQIIGSDKEIVGGIEANDYTTASFKVIPKGDAPVVVRISYTDSVGVRREVEKAVLFRASTYNYRITKEASQDNRALVYIIIGVVGIVIIIVLFRILKKRRSP